jgi:hypothetical protein
MHPLLAASFANAVVADRSAAARRRAVKRGADTSGPSGHVVPEADVGEVVIRRATSADAPALARLGALDGNRAAGELLAYAAGAAGSRGVLLAEADGALAAAVALDGGLAVADPFRASAAHARLLALRAGQLGADLPRRGGGHVRVLHPRTS